MSDVYGAGGVAVHVGTEVDGVVYDNVYPQGLPLENWLSDYGAGFPAADVWRVGCSESKRSVRFIQFPSDLKGNWYWMTETLMLCGYNFRAYEQ